MQLLKIRKTTANSIELISMVITLYTILNDIKINKTEIQILSYFIRYGLTRTTKEMIVRSHILNQGSLENTITRLRKVGLIVKNELEHNTVCKELLFTPENKMGIIVQLENL